MQIIYIVLGFILVMSFLVGFIKTINDNKKIRNNRIADDPKKVFNEKEINKNISDDLEIL